MPTVCSSKSEQFLKWVSSWAAILWTTATFVCTAGIIYSSFRPLQPAIPEIQNSLQRARKSHDESIRSILVADPLIKKAIGSRPGLFFEASDRDVLLKRIHVYTDFEYSKFAEVFAESAAKRVAALIDLLNLKIEISARGDLDVESVYDPHNVYGLLDPTSAEVGDIKLQQFLEDGESLPYLTLDGRTGRTTWVYIISDWKKKQATVVKDRNTVIFVHPPNNQSIAEQAGLAWGQQLLHSFIHPDLYPLLAEASLSASGKMEAIAISRRISSGLISAIEDMHNRFSLYRMAPCAVISDAVLEIWERVKRDLDASSISSDRGDHSASVAMLLRAAQFADDAVHHFSLFEEMDLRTTYQMALYGPILVPLFLPVFMYCVRTRKSFPR